MSHIIPMLQIDISDVASRASRAPSSRTSRARFFPFPSPSTPATQAISDEANTNDDFNPTIVEI